MRIAAFVPIVVIGLGGAASAPMAGWGQDAGAQGTLDVGTEDELRAAFADPAVVHVHLSTDVNLTCAGGGSLERHDAPDVVLAGNGHAIVQTCPDHRVVTVTGAGALALDGLELTGGRCEGDGGAVFSEGELVISGAVLHDNVAARQGGAVYGMTTVGVRDSRIHGNQAGLGGGALAARDDVSIEVSTLWSNVAGRTDLDWPATGACVPSVSAGAQGRAGTYSASDGGAVRSMRSVRIEASELRDNRAGRDGGAVLAERDILLDDVRVLDNESVSSGGGVRAFGGVSIVASTLTGNVAGGSGGGVEAFRDVEIAGSVLAHNTAAGRGGAVAASADVRIVDTTVEANASATSGGGVSVDAIGDLVIERATLVRNEAAVGANLRFARGTVTLVDAIVAEPRGGGANCEIVSGSVSSDGVVDDDGSCVERPERGVSAERQPVWMSPPVALAVLVGTALLVGVAALARRSRRRRSRLGADLPPTAVR